MHIPAETSYQRCLRLAEEARARKLAQCRQRGHWWESVDWLSWLDEPGAVARPTEQVCMITMSGQYRRALATLDRWWVYNTLRFAYDQRHELPLQALLAKRNSKLVFIEVGRKGSGRYKAIEMPAA